MTMRRTWALTLLVVALMSGFLIGLPAVYAVDQEPAPKAAEKVEAPAAEMEEANMAEEELEDVKILKQAASKLKASDPELAAKLEQLAEDLSW